MRRIVVTLVMSLVILTAVSFAPAELVSHWKFDEGSGDTAFDSADGNHGTIYGAQWTTGVFNGALSFDGYQDYVYVGHKDNLESQTLTLSFWAQIDNPMRDNNGGVANGEIFGNVNMYTYKLNFFEGIAQASVVDTTYKHYAISTDIVDSDWHMWTMTADNGILKLYKDAIFADEINYPEQIAYVGDFFVIGARYDGDYSLQGKIDDVRVYNHALSVEEIHDILPEPGSILLLSFGGLFLSRRQRKITK